MATFFNRATLTYGTNSIVSNTVSGELVQTLAVDKNASTENYTLGNALTYAISLVNSGTTNLTGLTVTDDLGEFEFATGVNVRPLTYTPESVLYFINGVVQPTPTVATEAPLAITGISVPAGGNAVIVYNATANEFAPLTAGATITNTATVSGNSALGDITAEETVSAAATPLLSILKSLSPDTVAENGTLTYTLLVENRGNTAATTALTVSDTFDPILENIAVTYNGATWTEGVEYTYNETTGEFETLPNSLTVPAATYTTDPATGEITIVPGTATIRITGTV